MVTEQQAKEIRQHLINELNKSGFGNVVSQVNTRLEEEYNKEKFERNSRYLLDFFLTESIEVLENLSNDNYPELINRFNEYTKGDQRIEGVSVELLDEGEPTFYDLKNLPSYNKIISSFREILNEIRNEN